MVYFDCLWVELIDFLLCYHHNAHYQKQLEASMVKLKQSKDYYKQKWLQLIREVNKLTPTSEEG